MTPAMWWIWTLILASAVMSAVYACWPQYWSAVLLIVALTAALTFGAVVARRAVRAEIAAHSTGFGADR